MKFPIIITASIISASAALASPDQSLKEKSMDMLYKYLPAADSANYSRDFFSHNVDMSLRARKEMPWGERVPEREFLHFVVPVRVNNEALDNHREVFYNELKDRVKGLSMKDAILEINHWCHEKVTYQPSDGRTHSPLESVSSAIGRCGEESTFGVAALRAMGIPARQVYTPRWAHTDDNHAWVEAWADGQWYFLGACEPEPVLNLGWFNSPASRGMLMHARVFGPYQGEEEILSRADGITDINVTDHYAPVNTLIVTVTDINGKPIKDADVSFRIYNYSEYYPLASKLTDSNGRASIIAGLGDLLVWATDGNNYTFEKASVGKDRNISLTLGEGVNVPQSIDLEITPPAAGAALVTVSDSQREENNHRFSQEDSIRLAYVATFVKPVEGDSISNILALSRGNHALIKQFLADNNYSPKAVALLKSLTEKDLTDVRYEILADHIAAEDTGHPLFDRYVMSPRISTERLTPFRSHLLKAIPVKDRKKFVKNPSEWVKWVKNNIDATKEWFPISVTMDPAAVWSTRKTSALSRDIFFVAGARAMGIPARIDPVTGKPQWADANSNWIDAGFNTSAPVGTNTQKYTLTLPYSSNGAVDEPLYYTHFSVSKIENGQPQLLNYPDFVTNSSTFAKGEQLDKGTYMVVTGQRLASGGVLSHIDFVDLNNGDVTMPLSLRSDSTQIQVIGSFDAESRYTPVDESVEKSVLATTGRGYYVIGIVKPGHEPSNHVLRDIAAIGSDLEKEGTPIVLLTATPELMKKIDAEMLSALPSTVTLGSDTTGTIASALHEVAKSEEWPVIVIADTFNRVVYTSAGYNIGLGQKLLDTLRRLK